jgi:hypothetical protein
MMLSLILSDFDGVNMGPDFELDIICNSFGFSESNFLFVKKESRNVALEGARGEIVDVPPKDFEEGNIILVESLFSWGRLSVGKVETLPPLELV